MVRSWHFSINQFLVATKQNIKKAFKLSIFHDTHLKKRMDDNPGDTDYAFAYNRYHPLHIMLYTAYTSWKGKGGMQKGETLSVKQLLKLLPAKVNKIDLKIQDVHEKGSSRYVQLFPKAHKPFYRGSQDSRILALNVLSLTIGSETELAAVKTIVDAAYNELNDAKNRQEESKGTKIDSSVMVEAARVAAMVGQYQDVGFFINKFPTQPKLMESLFDISTLTNPDQVIWKGHLDILEIHALLIRTFEIGDKIRIKSLMKGDIGLYLASHPGGTDSAEVLCSGLHQITFDVALFEVENLKEHRYLTIVNKSATQETMFVVQLY